MIAISSKYLQGATQKELLEGLYFRMPHFPSKHRTYILLIRLETDQQLERHGFLDQQQLERLG